MADPTVQTEATTTAAQEAAAALLSAKDGKNGEGTTTQTKPDTTEKTGTDTTTNKTEVAEESPIVFKRITQDAEGKYILKVNDGTVYKGDSPDDVLNQLAEGKDKADRYIKQIKQIGGRFQASTEASKAKLTEAQEDAGIKVPDENAIFRKHLDNQVKVLGLDPKMIGWKREQLKEYQQQKDLEPWEMSSLIAKIERAVERAQTSAEAEIVAANRAFVDVRTLDTEKQLVSEALDEFLEEMDIEEDAFDFDEMYEKAAKNRDKDGFIKPGSLMNEYRKAEREIRRSKSTVQKDVDEVRRKAEDAKRKIHEAGGGATITRKSGKAPTMEEASDALRAKIRSGQIT